jgi:hypothetical protein
MHGTPPSALAENSHLQGSAIPEPITSDATIECLGTEDPVITSRPDWDTILTELVADLPAERARRWDAVATAYAAGAPVRAIGCIFKLDPKTIRERASRQGWKRTAPSAALAGSGFEWSAAALIDRDGGAVGYQAATAPAMASKPDWDAILAARAAGLSAEPASRWDAIHEVYVAGAPVRAIARAFQRDPKTIREKASRQGWKKGTGDAASPGSGPGAAHPAPGAAVQID